MISSAGCDIQERRSHRHEPQPARAGGEAPKHNLPPHLRRRHHGGAREQDRITVHLRFGHRRSSHALARPRDLLPPRQMAPEEARRRDRRLVLHHAGGQPYRRRRVPAVLHRRFRSVLGRGPKIGGPEIRNH